MKTEVKNFIISENVISDDASYRGGTLKIDVSSIFPNVEDAVMGAYQNYLGGGMRGAVIGASMFEPDELSEKDKVIFFELKEKIKRFFHALTSDEEIEMNDEWNKMDYEKNQAMPVSAY